LHERCHIAPAEDKENNAATRAKNLSHSARYGKILSCAGSSLNQLIGAVRHDLKGLPETVRFG
jgi:hypothetical protein